MERRKFQKLKSLAPTLAWVLLNLVTNLSQHHLLSTSLQFAPSLSDISISLVNLVGFFLEQFLGRPNLAEGGVDKQNMSHLSFFTQISIILGQHVSLT